MAGLLKLTVAEAVEYEGLPKDVILRKYIKSHCHELCGHCLKFIGNHSLKRLRLCAEADTSKVKIEKALQP